MVDCDVEASDILVCIRKEVDGISSLENDLTSHVRSCTSHVFQSKVDKMLYKVRELSKCATILREKIIEYCESNGLSTENLGLNECSVSDKLLLVNDEAVTNAVPAVPLKKPQKKILSIRQFSAEDLQLVPCYMKGRLTIKNINDFIEKFNTVIQIKYNILKKPKKLLTSNEKQYAIAFKDQETTLVKGHYFCIAEDIKVFCNYSFVNTSWSIITILRHCRLIREIREPKLPIKYAIVKED